MSVSFPNIPDEHLHHVMDCVVKYENPVIFDFSEENEKIGKLDLNNKTVFCNYIFGTIKDNGSGYGIGRYNEDRMIYRRSAVFGTARTVHLGIDIWAPEGSKVYAPLTGRIHSFRDNNNHGDYGPTIIMQHSWEEFTFHTLYGHLDRASLINLRIGDKIETGEWFTSLGSYEENVHWPPHLHFQIVLDMEGMTGDYPGVCARDERDKYLRNCPNPNLLMRIPALKQHDIGTV